MAKPNQITQLDITNKMSLSVGSSTNNKNYFEEFMSWRPQLDVNDIFGEVIPYAADPTAADTNVTSNPAILQKLSDYVMDEIPLSNGQGYSLYETPGDTNSVRQKDFVLPQKYGPGYGFVLKDNGGTVIPLTAGAYQFDYANGILRFDDAHTPATMGWSLPLTMTVYQYIGPKISGAAGGGGSLIVVDGITTANKDSSASIPADSFIEKIKLMVSEPYDSGASIQVSVDGTVYLDSADYDITTPGVIIEEIDTSKISSDSVVSVIVTGATSGSSKVSVLFGSETIGGGGSPTTGDFHMPENMVMVDPRYPEVPGERYQTWAAADTYVQSQSPSTTNRWGIRIAGTNAENIIVRSWVGIYGYGTDATRLTGAITSTVLAGNPEYTESVIMNCRVDNVALDTFLTMIHFIQCEVYGSTLSNNPAVIFSQSVIKGGDYTATLIAFVMQSVFGGGSFGNSLSSWNSLVMNDSAVQFYGGSFYSCSLEGGTNIYNSGNYDIVNCNCEFDMVVNVGNEVKLSNVHFSGVHTITMNGGAVTSEVLTGDITVTGTGAWSNTGGRYNDSLGRFPTPQPTIQGAIDYLSRGYRGKVVYSANTSGSNIPAFKVVYVDNILGATLIPAVAAMSSSITANQVPFGIVMAQLNDASYADVVVFGNRQITGFNTSGASLTDPVYVDSNGDLTLSKTDWMVGTVSSVEPNGRVLFDFSRAGFLSISSSKIYPATNITIDPAYIGNTNPWNGVFGNLDEFFAYIENRRLVGKTSVVLVDGSHSVGSLVIDHPDSELITISAATNPLRKPVAKTDISLSSSGDLYTVVVNNVDVTSLNINDYVIIRASTTDNTAIIHGMWKITAISGTTVTLQANRYVNVPRSGSPSYGVDMFKVMSTVTVTGRDISVHTPVKFQNINFLNNNDTFVFYVGYHDDNDAQKKLAGPLKLGGIIGIYTETMGGNCENGIYMSEGSLVTDYDSSANDFIGVYFYNFDIALPIYNSKGISVYGLFMTGNTSAMIVSDSNISLYGGASLVAGNKSGAVISRSNGYVHIIAINNQSDGVSISAGSRCYYYGVSKYNSGSGIVIGGASIVSGSVESMYNGGNGVIIDGGSKYVHGSSRISNNVGDGVKISGNSYFKKSDMAHIQFNNNGINIGGGSYADVLSAGNINSNTQDDFRYRSSVTASVDSMLPDGSYIDTVGAW